MSTTVKRSYDELKKLILHWVDEDKERMSLLCSELAKFAVGIFLWNMKGLIDINNPDDVSKVHLILKVLDQTPGYDFFDNVFHEADPDMVCPIIGMSPVVPLEEVDLRHRELQQTAL